MNANRILVASTAALRRLQIKAGLEFEGYEVSETETAVETIQRACFEPHDLLIMDSILDGIDAHRLCRTIRPQSNVSIIVLDDGSAARCGITAIDALNAGADEYLSAACASAELAARVRAMLRRVVRRDETEIVLQDRAIDWNSHKIKGPGGRISHLTPKEYLVLQHLVTNANKPLTPQRLAQTVWQRDGSGQLEYVRIVVKQLRRKLEPDPDHPRYILTQRSVGYQFQMPA